MPRAVARSVDASRTHTHEVLCGLAKLCLAWAAQKAGPVVCARRFTLNQPTFPFNKATLSHVRLTVNCVSGLFVNGVVAVVVLH